MDERDGAGLRRLLGLCAFGLLLANLPGMAGVWPSADLPEIGGRTLGAADAVAWWTGQTLVSWTFNIVLIAAFGGWLAWQQDRGLRVPLGWMLLLGLVLAYFVWFGELISILAIASMIALPLRAMQPASRLVTALVLVGGTLLIVVAGSAVTALLPDTMEPGQLLGFGAEQATEAEAAHRAGYFAQLPRNMATALQWHLMEVVFLGGGVLGLAMIGMLALETGFAGGRWAPMHYVLVAAVCLGLGLPLTGWAAAAALARDFAPSGLWQSNGAHATGALLCAAGFAALISLAGNQARLVPVTRLLEQAGEIWLSLYTGQLLIGLALFSLLPGLSLYGRLGPAGLALTGFLLCVVQALAVWAWSRSFRTGPVEWLLDRLSRRQFGPLRRGPGA
ncbi:MAG: hypothetical protein CMH94_09035 [Oceanicaulis sp.]|nr:hypothetical protein [Oceanicaulis sp.]